MPFDFQPTVPEDMPAVSALMLAAFKAGPDAPFVDPSLLYWKYFEPGPRWPGSRGYVLKSGADILAHCGIWPINLICTDKSVTCNLFVDWVSDRKVPGAGFLLKKKLMSLTDATIVVGGSEDTRAVVPKMGFQPAGEVSFFVKIVRPWKQYRTRPSEGISRDTARLLRNTFWSHSTINASIPKDWSAEVVTAFADNDLVTTCQNGHPTPWRNAEYLNYWLRSPSAVVSSFLIRRSKKVLGYFLLSRVGGQTRIADIRLNSTKQDEWNVAYCLAARAAARDPETCEIIAAASTLFSELALLSSGFRQRGGAPIFLFDPQAKLIGSPAIFWNMVDADAAYLYDPEHPYTT